MQDDLNPCPFCGSFSVRLAEVDFKHSHNTTNRGHCLKCNAYGPPAVILYGDKINVYQKQKALDLWNKRVVVK